MEFLTVKDAAARAGVRPVSIRKAIADNRLVARKFADRWMIDSAELERWRAEGKHTPGRVKSVNSQQTP